MSSALTNLRRDLMREMIRMVYAPLRAEPAFVDEVCAEIVDIKQAQAKRLTKSIARQPKAMKPTKPKGHLDRNTYADYSLPHGSDDLWCTGCRNWHHRDVFALDNGRPSGHKSQCKAFTSRRDHERSIKYRAK